MASFDYWGKCYRCEEEKHIMSEPCGGVRYCQECLLDTGELVLECVGISKKQNDWENLTFKEIFLKCMAIIVSSGLGTYIMFKELNEPVVKDEKGGIPEGL